MIFILIVSDFFDTLPDKETLYLFIINELTVISATGLSLL